MAKSPSPAATVAEAPPPAPPVIQPEQTGEPESVLGQLNAFGDDPPNGVDELTLPVEGSTVETHVVLRAVRMQNGDNFISFRAGQRVESPALIESLKKAGIEIAAVSDLQHYVTCPHCRYMFRGN